MIEPDMKKNNNKGKLIAIITLIAVLVLGVSYAYYSYLQTGSKSKQVIFGDIHLNLTEGDQITVTELLPDNVMPENEDPLDFTISGTNESERPIYYEVKVVQGDDSETSGAIRIDDEYVSMTLQKYNTGTSSWDTIVDKQNYAHFGDGQQLTVGTVAANSTVSDSYRLYIWMNDEIMLYGGDLDQMYGDYRLEDIEKLYASVKIKVTADFKVKTQGTNLYKTLFDKANNKGVSDTTVVFSTPSGTDGKTGLYYMKDTASDTYPIYYYRGNVTTNNVVFGGYCWKIVRTTDTGGIKLIYNGTYDATDKCVHATNTNETTGIGTGAFNSNYKSLTYMGYSYPGTIKTKDGTTRAPYEWVANDTGLLSRTTVLYGENVEYGLFDNSGVKKYRLTGGTVTGAPDDTHHYSLNATSSDALDTKVRFYYYADKAASNGKNYYIELTGGDTITDAVHSMTEEPVNTYSTVQTKINNWYDTNLKTTYGDFVEDTVWCMERGASSLGGWGASGSITSYYNSKTYTRANSNWGTDKTPKLNCDNSNDELKYAGGSGNIGSKAALLTYDEIGMAGMKWYTNTTYSDNYLYTGYWYWFLSPAYFDGVGGFARAGYVSENGELGTTYVNNVGGVRPSISLKHGTYLHNPGATGTESDPYIVGNKLS